MGSKTADMAFLDTSYFKALLDPKDDFHIKANVISRNFEEEGVLLATTNFILNESLTFLRVRCGLDFAQALREKIALSRLLKIYRITAADEGAAWNWFVNNWSDLSFTDCVSFAVMKRLSLKRVAAFDQHFERAGYKMEKA